MKTVVAGLLMMLALACQAQDQKRIDAIWEAANDRMTNQIDTWYDDGEFPMVVQLLRIQRDLRPKDYDIVTNLGWMLENIEEWDEALSVYRRYRLDAPKDPDAFLPESEYWFRKKNWKEIITLLNGKIQDKSHANMFRVLAHSYERTGKFADSKKVWDRYLAMHPTDLAAKKNLERVEKKLKG